MAAPRNSFVGILLILIGLAFLIGQVTELEYSWTFILMGLGLAFLLRNVLERRAVSVFPGVLLLLLGLVFFAEDQRWELFRIRDAWPFIPGIVGLAFLAEWVFTKPRRGGTLFTSLILLAVGVMSILSLGNYMNLDLFSISLTWWPVILLLIGVYLLVKKPRQGGAKE